MLNYSIKSSVNGDIFSDAWSIAPGIKNLQSITLNSISTTQLAEVIDVITN